MSINPMDLNVVLSQLGEIGKKKNEEINKKRIEDINLKQQKEKTLFNDRVEIIEKINNEIKLNKQEEGGKKNKDKNKKKKESGEMVKTNLQEQNKGVFLNIKE